MGVQNLGMFYKCQVGAGCHMLYNMFCNFIKLFTVSMHQNSGVIYVLFFIFLLSHIPLQYSFV